MSTKVYGHSDDLVAFEGDISGEVGCYDASVLAAFDDGTVLGVRYGKDGGPGVGEIAVWAITVLHEGQLFERLDVCADSDAKVYSDVAHFRDGLAKAWFGKDLEVVR